MKVNSMREKTNTFLSHTGNHTVTSHSKLHTDTADYNDDSLLEVRALLISNMTAI